MNKAERIDKVKVELQDAINKYGYSLEPEHVLSILATLGAVWEADWEDRPTKRGMYWVTHLVDGGYREPHAVSVIDYEQPDKGIHVEDGWMHYVPVEEYVTDYYPSAKFMFIETPIIPKVEG